MTQKVLYMAFYCTMRLDSWLKLDIIVLCEEKRSWVEMSTRFERVKLKDIGYSRTIITKVPKPISVSSHTSAWMTQPASYQRRERPRIVDTAR